MHEKYLRENNSIRFDDLCLTGGVGIYLAKLNAQAQNCLESESVTEELKATNWRAWIGVMNN
ncbi:TnpV protein [Holdemania filiformis]|uniref:TnpV protein n=1 Tax=Holdemania filiformis TaxID=61171 RepID=UPI0024315E08|nr:TnpV protein [Holdemania filiformis]